MYKAIVATVIKAIIGYAFLDRERFSQAEHHKSHPGRLRHGIPERDSPVVVGDQVGQMSVANEPRSGRKSTSEVAGGELNAE